MRVLSSVLAAAVALGVSQIAEAQGFSIAERVSTDGLGNQLNEASAEPTISGNGRYVAFISEVASLDGCTGTSSGTLWGTGRAHVYVKDRQTGAVECVSKASDGTPGNAR